MTNSDFQSFSCLVGHGFSGWLVKCEVYLSNFCYRYFYLSIYIYTNSKVANRQPVGRKFFFQGGQDQVIILWSYFDASKAVCVVDANFQKKTSLFGKGFGNGLPME